MEEDSVRNALAAAHPQRRETGRLQIAAPDEGRIERARELPETMRPDDQPLNGAQPGAVDRGPVNRTFHPGVGLGTAREATSRDQQRSGGITPRELPGEPGDAASHWREIVGGEDVSVDGEGSGLSADTWSSILKVERLAEDT